MNTPYQIILSLFLSILLAACGKSPEERRIEVLESQIQSIQKRDSDFNRIFKEAIVMDPESTSNITNDGIPLTILGTWRRDLMQREAFLILQSEAIKAETYKEAAKTNEEIQNALQWTKAALKEVGRYTQLYYELEYSRSGGKLSADFAQKLNEADVLHQKLPTSLKISLDQETTVLARLKIYGDQKKYAEKLRREAEEGEAAKKAAVEKAAKEAERRRGSITEELERAIKIIDSVTPILQESRSHTGRLPPVP